MCTSILICHGDGPLKASDSCNAQAFYITTDKKYAIPVELVKFDEQGEANFPNDAPRYEIKVIKIIKNVDN